MSFEKENLKLLFYGFANAFKAAACAIEKKKILSVHSADLDGLFDVVYIFMDHAVDHPHDNENLKLWREAVEYEMEEVMLATSGEVVNYCNAVRKILDMVSDPEQRLELSLGEHLDQSAFDQMEQLIISEAEVDPTKMPVKMVFGPLRNLTYLPSNFYPENDL